MRALVAAMLLLGTAACGGAEAERSAPRKASQAQSGAETTVSVDLKEYTVTPDRDSAPAGEVTFKLGNSGKVGHALSVLRTDLPPDELPIGGSWVVDITAPGIEVAGFVPVFDPGNVQTLTVSLEPGKYVLLCNLGHYQYGMHTPFTVG